MLEKAVQAGVNSIALEYKGGSLMLFYQAGAIGFGAGCIADDLKQAFIAELYDRANLARKKKGRCSSLCEVRTSRLRCCRTRLSTNRRIISLCRNQTQQ